MRAGVRERVRGEGEGEGEIKREELEGLLTWRAACRCWEKRDALALSCSRPWISCSSLCRGRKRVRGPPTHLDSPPGLRAASSTQGQQGLCGKLPSTTPPHPRL